MEYLLYGTEARSGALEADVLPPDVCPWSTFYMELKR